MTHWRRTRPAADEAAPYYWAYIDQLPDGDVLDILETQHEQFQTLCRSIDDERSLHRYAADKWSIREVVGHLVDTERVFALRSLAFARGEQAELPGMEQDAWVRAADFDRRDWHSLLDEARAGRASNLVLWKSLDDDVAQRTGIASGCRFSVRAVPYVVAGHEHHHMTVLQSKYL